ncbi:serine hydrolase domain-containing protein [Bauldia sp.]|uniref:serine hydrolase domain-containing protein n=1 Tax=Bauldia sp. TaxID=2575872 RepID=UPI003BA94C1D
MAAVRLRSGMRRVLIAATAILAITPAAALTPLPPQPADVPWPTETWATGPLPPGTDEAALDAALAVALDGEPDAYGNTSAVIIVQGGRIVRERYGADFDADTRMISWSLAKSFTQAIAGVAVEQGLIDIDEPMGNSRWAADDPRAAIPWRQWLTMTDGQSFREVHLLPSQTDVGPMLFGEGRHDVGAFAAALPLENEPGTTWNYNSAGMNLIADALTDIVAGPDASPEERQAAMRAWMDAGLFDPIGMTSAIPEFDAAGLFLGSSFVYATARDFARFALLYLRDGQWDGARVLPEGWVDFARTPTAADFYGAGWWVGMPGRDIAGVFRGSGRGGQVMLLVPEKDLIVLRLGNNEGLVDRRAMWTWIGRMVDAFPDEG